MLLRDTNVINSILFNSEVWVNLTKEQVTTLENIDIMYLRKLYEAHSKAPIEAFYLESGKMPIRFVIQIRRLMYWWHLNNVPETSLIQRCYKAQKSRPAKKDWIYDLEKDKEDFNINITDEQIKTMSKHTFKKIIKTKARNQAIEYLNVLKSTHSKLDNIQSEDLTPKEYLKDERLNPSEAKLLFKLRTRMFDCKQNFKNRYGENIFLFCELCTVSADSQSHLLDCFVLKNCISELRNNEHIRYEHIFESVDRQVPAVKLINKIVITRDLILQKINV